ncbi:hypothetical protein ACJX0J_006584, partial [Zea mays]
MEDWEEKSNIKSSNNYNKSNILHIKLHTNFDITEDEVTHRQMVEVILKHYISWHSKQVIYAKGDGR